MKLNSVSSLCLALFLCFTVGFGLLPKQVEAQTYTPTPPGATNTPAGSPTATPTTRYIFGGTASVTPTPVLQNDSCPPGSWSPVNLDPAWAAVCAHCFPQPTRNPLAGAAATITVPARTIPSISLFTPTVGASNTPSPTYTSGGPTLTPTATSTPNVNTVTFTADMAGRSPAAAQGLQFISGQGWLSHYQNGQAFSQDFGAYYYVTSIRIRWFRHASPPNAGGVGHVYFNGANVYNDPSGSSGYQIATINVTDQWADSVEFTVTGSGAGSLWSLMWVEVTYGNNVPTMTPAASSTATPTPTATATRPFSHGLFALAPQDCSTPVYVNHSPAVEAGIGITGETECYTLFGGLHIDAVEVLGISTPEISIPEFEVCLEMFTIRLVLAGVVIDVLSILAAALVALFFRWLVFN